MATTATVVNEKKKEKKKKKNRERKTKLGHVNGIGTKISRTSPGRERDDLADSAAESL